MIYRGRHRNPGVRYQYTVDRRRGAPGEEGAEGTEGAEAQAYRWGAADWTVCSRACGGGLMRQPVVCLNNSNGQSVPSSYATATIFINQTVPTQKTGR